MKSILVFGAGELQTSLIKNVKELGYQAVVIDPNPEAEGQNEADIFEIVAADDFDATLSVAKKHSVAALVTAAADNPLPMMAKIAETLNLCFPSYDSVMSVLDKSMFKSLLQKHQIPCASGSSFHISDPPNLTQMSFPVIIKPNKNSGSRGVVKCNSIAELEAEIANVQGFCKDGRYIIEEFIEGDEISVEGFVFSGKLEIIQITDKVLSRPPYNVEMGHIQPSKYIKRKDEIAAYLQKLIEVTGLDNCAIHPELKVNRKGIYIIELGPRLGGDYITSHLVPLSTGINMEHALIKIAIGANPVFNYHHRCSLIQYLSLPTGTVVHNPESLELLRNQFPELHDFKLFLAEGQVAKQITSSLNRHGFWILSGENRELLAIRSTAINSIVEISIGDE